ncbi:MAG: ChbG/HpnK family deacetylase [Hyphomicrobiales bacterium]|nr:ChbG/HpnK family deacetylase [Hyphomicrobiales bacterium]MBV9427113.1 ChbG/HpnK family deacetylase [Bradyrhizobiaceae bacterium]
MKGDHPAYPASSVVSPLSSAIWLCADDYGIARGVNTAIRDLIMRGRLNAASVMVVPPAFTRAEARSLAILNNGTPRAAIGLHLTLTAPFRPLMPGFQPLRDGGFPLLRDLFKAGLLRRLNPATLAAEIDAQLSAFTAAFGRPPDFIDGHQHAHLAPQVRDAVLAAAKRRAPGAWVRQCGSVQPAIKRLGDPKGLLLNAFSRAMRARAQTLGVPTNPAFAGTYGFRSGADFARKFPRFLDALPDGGVVMCHPGHVDEELIRLDPLTDLREREYAYLAGDTFPATLARAGFALARPPIIQAPESRPE